MIYLAIIGYCIVGMALLAVELRMYRSRHHTDAPLIATWRQALAYLLLALVWPIAVPIAHIHKQPRPPARQ